MEDKIHSLQFDENGKFRILTLSDIHAQVQKDEKSISFIQHVLHQIRPNLIVLLGDQLQSLKNTGNTIETAISNFMVPITESQIPFAVIFGNHDPEIGMKLEDQMKIYQSYPTCLGRCIPTIENENEAIFEFEKEKIAISGCGNYNLLIKDSKNEKFIFNLWFADSGHSDETFIQPNQVEWYDNTYHKIINEVNAYNNKISPNQTNSNQIHSLWFQHRAVEEIYDLMIKSDFPVNTTSATKGYQFGHFVTLKPGIRSDPNGMLLEGPDIIEREENRSRLYERWVQNGDVLGACFGHNHGDSFYAFSEDNIGLGFDSSAGWIHTYAFPGLDKGGRIFDLDENDLTSFTTRMVYYHQVVPNTKIDFLTRVITYGHFNAAISYFVKTIIPRPLQIVLGRRIMKELKKHFCPKHLQYFNGE